MTAKLHINMNQGLVEAEGSEEFVLKVYNDFKDKIAPTHYSTQNTGQQNQPPPSSAPQSTTKKATAPQKDSTGKSGGSKKKSAAKGYSLNKDLNLYKEDDKPSLEDFMKNYTANSNPPRYLLFTHYLKNIKGVEKVGPNEIYTCMKRLGGIKIPNIIQGLWDTSSKKGWLDTSSIEDVFITVAGENAIDLELPKKQEAAA